MASIASVMANPVFWAAFVLFALALYGLARWRRLRWRPAWYLRFGLGSLVLLGLLAPGAEPVNEGLSKRQVIVVDQSDSLSPQVRQQIRTQAEAWQAAAQNRLIIGYGVQPEAVLTGSAAWPDLDGRASNLEAALLLAGDLLGPDPGQAIVVSDGLVASSDDVEARLSDLLSSGHTVEIVRLPARGDAADGYVGPLSAPANLWAGTPFEVVVPVFPPQGEAAGQVFLAVNGQRISAAPEPVLENWYRFRVPPQNQGITTLEVTAEFEQDPFPANNSAFTTLQVFAAPPVLVVTPQPLSPAAGNFVQLLTQNNLPVDVTSPEQFPTDLETLQRFRVIFLHNLLSSQLNQEQMLSLQVFVSRLAGGLVFIGGRNSYTLGGYSQTLLEPMLPVKLEPPPRSERPPIVFLLVLDRSASMGTGFSSDEPRPIELAREAAMRAIEAMQAHDYLGVLTFNDGYEWTVPVRPLGSGLELRQALDAVSQVRPAGSTHMYVALERALAAMHELPGEAPSNRHLLVLSDGQSYDGSMEEFRSLAQSAQAAGITVSTIAFGEEADEETMATIAEAGKGRFYSVSHADELPRILVYESQAARSENIQAGSTSLELGEGNHPILSGLSPLELPTLSGYNALSSKADQGSEDVLVSSSFQDPILAAWQYGLGRVVAWTSDIGEEWAGNWPVAGDAGKFWSQVVRYSLVNPALGPAQVAVQSGETELVVDAALQGKDGRPINLARLNFTYADASGQTHTFVVPQSGPGTYRLVIPRPAEGAYRAILSYPGEAGEQVEVPAPFAVNPPDEWLPANPQQGWANLAEWARMAGEEVLSLEAIQAMAGESQEESVVTTGAGWRGWLLPALILFWLLEIAIRRRWLPWS